MQRVRIGLTGLDFVFLLVLLAAIFVSPSEEERITAHSIEQRLSPDDSTITPSPSVEAPKEPLAELGVAPGNVESNAVVAESQPEE